MKFDRHIRSGTTAELPVEFHSDRTTLNANLAASRLCEILSDIGIGPWSLCPNPLAQVAHQCRENIAYMRHQSSIYWNISRFGNRRKQMSRLVKFWHLVHQHMRDITFRFSVSHLLISFYVSIFKPATLSVVCRGVECKHLEQYSYHHFAHLQCKNLHLMQVIFMLSLFTLHNINIPLVHCIFSVFWVSTLISGLYVLFL